MANCYLLLEDCRPAFAVLTDAPTILALRQTQSLSPLTLTGFVDRSDQPFSPTKGYEARLDIEHASAFTGSDYHAGSIEIARQRAEAAGVADQIRFEIAPAAGYAGHPPRRPRPLPSRESSHRL